MLEKKETFERVPFVRRPIPKGLRSFLKSTARGGEIRVYDLVSGGKFEQPSAVDDRRALIGEPEATAEVDAQRTASLDDLGACFHVEVHGESLDLIFRETGSWAQFESLNAFPFLVFGARIFQGKRFANIRDSAKDEIAVFVGFFAEAAQVDAEPVIDEEGGDHTPPSTGTGGSGVVVDFDGLPGENGARDGSGQIGGDTAFGAQDFMVEARTVFRDVLHQGKVAIAIWFGDFGAVALGHFVAFAAGVVKASFREDRLESDEIRRCLLRRDSVEGSQVSPLDPTAPVEDSSDAAQAFPLCPCFRQF